MDPTKRNAERIEALLPRIMRALFRPDESDPISDLPMAQLRLMRVLYRACLSGTEICHELHISPSAFSQLSHRLEEAGLVTYHVDEVDRRVKRYSLTDLGWTLMDERRGRRIEKAAQALATLDPDQQAAIMDALALLLDTCRQAFPQPELDESLQLTAELEQSLPILKSS